MRCAAMMPSMEVIASRCGDTNTGDDKLDTSIRQGIQDILWSLMFGAGDVRVGAAREIRRLTKNSAKSRVYLAAAGVICPLVLMLKSTSLEAQEAALLALLNLAVGNERNKLKIVKAGAVGPLVDLLKSGDDAVRESAAAAIYTLSAASSNKAPIGSSGAIPLLVDTLTSGSVQGKVDAVMALYNLSTHPDNLPAILSAKPVAPLLLLLKSCKKAGNVAEKASSLLESLSAFDDGRTAIAGMEGGILTLVEVLEDGSSKSREYAVGTLVKLCQSDRSKFRGAILSEGVIPGLLELTVQGTQRAQQMAHTLLELLRESPSRNSSYSSSSGSRNSSSSSSGGGSSPCAVIESIVSDIAAHVDGKKSSAGTARKMLTEMVQLSMEQSMRHLQQRALGRAPSRVLSRPSSSSSDDVSS